MGVRLNGGTGVLHIEGEGPKNVQLGVNEAQKETCALQQAGGSSQPRHPGKNVLAWGTDHYGRPKRYEYPYRR